MQSINVELSEQVYTAIARAAASGGVSVEAIIVQQLEADFADGGDVPATFFSSRILAEIDDAIAEADDRGSLPLSEVMSQIATKSRAWRANHPA